MPTVVTLLLSEAPYNYACSNHPEHYPNKVPSGRGRLLYLLSPVYNVGGLQSVEVYSFNLIATPFDSALVE